MTRKHESFVGDVSYKPMLVSCWAYASLITHWVLERWFSVGMYYWVQVISKHRSYKINLWTYYRRSWLAGWNTGGRGLLVINPGCGYLLGLIPHRKWHVLEIDLKGRVWPFLSYLSFAGIVYKTLYRHVVLYSWAGQARMFVWGLRHTYGLKMVVCVINWHAK
jgi:hypothetical protein